MKKLLTSKERMMYIPLFKVVPHPLFQMRDRDNMDLEPLKRSIDEKGMIHKPTVRPKGKEYELTAGYRRFCSVEELGWKGCMFSVRELTDEDAVLLALAENMERKDISPMEEAEFFRKAMDEVKIKGKQLAETMKKSEAYISNRLRLLELEEPVQRMINKGDVSPGHAEHSLLKMKEYPKLQVGLAKSIVKRKFTVNRAEDEMRSMIYDEKERLKFLIRMEKAKFKTCPKCKKRAIEFSYREGNFVRCLENHTWDVMTGEDPDSESYTRREGIRRGVEKRKKMKYPRTNYFQIPYEKITKMAKKKTQREIAELLKKVVPGKVPLRVHIHIGEFLSKNYEELDITIDNESITLDTNKTDSHFKFEPKTKATKDVKLNFVKAFVDGFESPTKKDHDFMREFLGYPEQVSHSGKPVSKAKEKEKKRTPTPAAQMDIKPIKGEKRCPVCHRSYPTEKNGVAVYDSHMQKHGWVWSNKQQKYVEPHRQAER